MSASLPKIGSMWVMKRDRKPWPALRDERGKRVANFEDDSPIVVLAIVNNSVMGCAGTELVKFVIADGKIGHMYYTWLDGVAFAEV